MRIPTQINVGQHRYKVEQVTHSPKANTMGAVSYDTKAIYIARRSRYNQRYSQHEKQDTFWHELTHAILKDMGSHLESDEKFVTAFANRLTKAIASAKFD